MLLVFGLGAARAARATGNDFLDETIVARGLERGEMGFELATDLRHDVLDHWQAFYQPAVEFGPTSRLTFELVSVFVSRGAGLEYAGWRGESRCRISNLETWPVQVALSLEYEVENSAAKHVVTEKSVRPGIVLSGEPVKKWLLTGNLGPGYLLENLPLKARTAANWALGLRYPEGGEFKAGFEVRHAGLERETRFSPQLWLELPGEIRIRAGFTVGRYSRPYRNLSRLIVEKEF